MVCHVNDHWELITCCWAENPRARPDIKLVSESVQNHYQVQFAAADRQVVPCILNTPQTTPADNAVIFRSALFSMLAFIWALILGSFVLCHTLMNWLRSLLSLFPRTHILSHFYHCYPSRCSYCTYSHQYLSPLFNAPSDLHLLLPVRTYFPVL